MDTYANTLELSIKIVQRNNMTTEVTILVGPTNS